jgi:hypothetical protein
MITWQVVGVCIEFAASQLVQSRLGLASLILLTLLLVAVRTGHPRLACWSAALFFLLTLQLQT